MTRRRDSEEVSLSPEDHALVERVREAFSPPPWPPARRAAFDRALAQRLEAAPALGRRALSGLAIAASVLLALVLWGPFSRAPGAGAGVAARSEPGYELLLPPALGTPDTARDDLLPPGELRAIADLLLDV